MDLDNFNFGKDYNKNISVLDWFDIVLGKMDHVSKAEERDFIASLYSLQNNVVRLFNDSLGSENPLDKSMCLRFRKISSALFRKISNYKSENYFDSVADRIDLSIVAEFLMEENYKLAEERLLILKEKGKEDLNSDYEIENEFFRLYYSLKISFLQENSQNKFGASPTSKSAIEKFFSFTTKEKNKRVSQENIPLLLDELKKIVSLLLNKERYKLCMDISSSVFEIIEDKYFEKMKFISMYFLKKYSELNEIIAENDNFKFLSLICTVSMIDVSENYELNLKKSIVSYISSPSYNSENNHWVIYSTHRAKKLNLLKNILLSTKDKSATELIKNILEYDYEIFTINDIKSISETYPDILEQLRYSVWNLFIREIGQTSDLNEVLVPLKAVIEKSMPSDSEFLLLLSYLETELNLLEESFVNLNKIPEEYMNNIYKLIYFKNRMSSGEMRFIEDWKDYLLELRSNCDSTIILDVLLYLSDVIEKKDAYFESFYSICIEPFSASDFDIDSVVEKFYGNTFLEYFVLFKMKNFNFKETGIEIKDENKLKIMKVLNNMSVRNREENRSNQELVTLIISLENKEFDKEFQKNDFLSLLLALTKEFIEKRSNTSTVNLSLSYLEDSIVEELKKQRDVSYFATRLSALKTLVKISDRQTDVKEFIKSEAKLKPFIVENYFFHEIIYFILDNEVEDRQLVLFVLNEFNMFVMNKTSIKAVTLELHLDIHLYVLSGHGLKIEHSSIILCNYLRTLFVNSRLSENNTFKNKATELSYLFSILEKRETYFRANKNPEILEELQDLLNKVKKTKCK